MRYCFINIFIFGLLNASLISPDNNSVLNYTHIVFEWEQEADAKSYNLQVSTDPDFIHLVVDIIDESLMYILKNSIEWNMEYYWRVKAVKDDGIDSDWIDVYSFSIGSYVDIFSLSAVMWNEDNYYPGYNLFGSLLEKKSWIMDSDGEFIWFSDTLNINPLSNILKNGNLLGMYFTDDGLVSYDAKLAIEYSIDKEIVWSNNDSLFAHHDIIVMPNGNYLMLTKETQSGPIPIGSWTPAFQSIGFVADGIVSEFPWEGDRIVEVDPLTNEIVWSWSVFDHYDMIDYDTLGGYWNSALEYMEYDWTHCNSLFFEDSDSSIYVSSRHLSRITKIDYITGEIIWNLGHQMQSDDIDMGNGICFSFQHDVNVLDNGNLLFLDNGNLSQYYCNSDNQVTRALELSIFDDNGDFSASIEWEYILDEMYAGTFMGSCQRLPNGNTLINPGAINQGFFGRVFEVDSDGQSIWEMGGSTIINRMYRVPSLYPQKFTVEQPNFAWYLPSPTTYLPLGDNCLHYTITNEGDISQTYQYSFEDNGIWFDDQEGSIDIESGQSHELVFSGSVFSEIYPHSITLSVYPLDSPDYEKSVSIDAWSVNNDNSGCNDPIACNYNPDVSLDDCSCTYDCLGDVNSDESLDVLDILVIIDIILLNIEPTEYQSYVSDFNSDNSIDVNDIIEIVEFILTNVN